MARLLPKIPTPETDAAAGAPQRCPSPLRGRGRPLTHHPRMRHSLVCSEPLQPCRCSSLGDGRDGLCSSAVAAKIVEAWDWRRSRSVSVVLKSRTALPRRVGAPLGGALAEQAP